MNKIVYFSVFVALWFTVASMFVSALQYSVKEMQRTPVAAGELRPPGMPGGTVDLARIEFDKADR